MTQGTSRTSASLAASLALHVTVLVLVTGNHLVQLTLEPAPILVTLMPASDRTAGPGQVSAELRQAARAEPVAPPVMDAARAVPVESEPAPAAAVKPRPVAKKIEHQRAPVELAPAATPTAVLASESAAASAAGGSAGSDARSSAPSWAPTARLRYEELLFAWMERHKQYPLLAQRRGLQGRGSVRVRIDRVGRVLERTLASSTGEPVLDQATLDMVRRASPFPSVPEEYAGASFEFVAPIEYRLR